MIFKKALEYISNTTPTIVNLAANITASDNHFGDVWGPSPVGLCALQCDSLDVVRSKAIDLHCVNAYIWAHEDLCRTTDDTCVAKHKREIDKLNQQRNDLIEEMDSIVIEHFGLDAINADFILEKHAMFSSEGVGSLFDRFSVSTLKEHHAVKMSEIKDCTDSATKRLNIIRLQISFLSSKLHQLCDEISSGKTFIISFKQLKTYNNKMLNKHYNLVENQNETAKSS